MASFDLEGARKAGYSDEEIRQYLLSQKGVKEARDAGYTDEDILAHFGFGVEPAPAQWDGPFRLVDLAGQGIFQGAASTIGLPGTLLDMAKKTWPGTPLDALGLPTIEDTTKFTNDLGLTGNPELVPQNDLEKYVNAGAEGFGSGLGIGGPLGIATSITSGLGAQVGADLLPDSVVGPIAGGLIGGLGFGGAVGALKKGLSAKAIMKEATEAEKALQAIKVAQMPANKAAMVEAATAKLAAAKAALAQARDNIAAGADAHIGNVANSLGKSKTLQEAGTKLQEEARNWLGKVLPKKLGDIWAPVDKKIPGDTPVMLSSFEGVLDQITKSAGNLEPLAQQMKPRLPASLKKSFEALKELQESGDIAEFSWGEVQKLRTTLGDALSDPMVIKDIGAQNLDALYAALSDDMRGAAKAVGVEDLFNSANESSKKLYQIAEGPIAKVISGVKASADDPAPEAVAKSFLNSGRNGATELEVLRAEIPKGVDELGSVYLRSGDWKKLSPEAQAVFVTDEPTRLGVSTQWDAKEAANSTYEAQAKEAAKRHGDELAQARTQLQQQVFDAKERVRKAQEDVGKLPKKTSIQEKLGGLSQQINGLAIGALGGQIMSPGSAMHSGVGAAAGALLPMITKTTKAIWDNPQIALPAAARGGLAGNALLPRQ